MNRINLRYVLYEVFKIIKRLLKLLKNIIFYNNIFNNLFLFGVNLFRIL